MAEPWIEGSLNLHCPGCGVSEQVKAGPPWTWFNLEEQTAPFWEKHRPCPSPEHPERKLFEWRVPLVRRPGVVSALVCAESAEKAVALLFAERVRLAEQLPVSEKRLRLLQEAELVQGVLMKAVPEVSEAQPWIPDAVVRDQVSAPDDDEDWYDRDEEFL